MSSPVGGARREPFPDLRRDIKFLRQNVRENSARISKLEHRTVWFTGFLSANVLIAIFNLVRSFLPDGGGQ